MTKQQFIIEGSFLTELITNSSSVVYTWVNSESALKEIIDEVLQDVGSDKTCDDLYNIYTVAKDVQYATEDWLSEESCQKLFGKSLEEANEDWKGTSELIKNSPTEFKAKITELMEDQSGGWEERYLETRFVVETKDGKESPITGMVRRLFDSYGEYNG